MADRLPAYPTPQEAFSNSSRRKSPPKVSSGSSQWNNQYQQPNNHQPQHQSHQPPPQHQLQHQPPHQPQYQSQPYSNQPQPYSNQAPQQYSAPPQHQAPRQAPQQAYDYRVPSNQPPAHNSRPNYQTAPVNVPREQSRIASNSSAPVGYHSPSHQPTNRTNTSQSSLQSSKPSSNVEAQLKEMFARYDIHRNGRLNEDELSNALVNFDRSKFRISTIKLMMKSFDTNGTGSLEFSEFYRLWNYLSSYSKLFQEADTDRSFTISFGEYQGIIKKIGYDLPTDTVLFIFSKFSGIADGGIPALKFDSFIESLFYLRKITDTFRKYDKESQGIALIKFQDFIVEVLSLK